MKTTLLFKNLIVLVLLVAASTISLSSQAQGLSFRNPTLYSGSAGADNAVYKFQFVNATLDALVKISGRSSALVTLSNIDVNSGGWDKAFQPQVSYNNGSTNSAKTWWMEFDITFVVHNTATPAILNTFDVTALDIDGDDNKLHEWDSFYGLTSYTLENNSSLSVSSLLQLILGLLQPVGKTFDGVLDDHGGIDTAATKLMATAKYNNKSNFKFRTGATTTGSSSKTERNYSMWFKSFNYTAPLVTILPVEFFSFTASLNQNRVDLKWTTASELNVNRFEVEKSYDGKNFTTAGLVFAVGTTAEKINYSFTDNLGNAQQTVIYYRLRTVDNDGKSQYSETRIVRQSKQSDGLKMITYPNPVSNELRITVPFAWQNKAVLFEIVNQNGQVVKTLKSSSASQTETIAVTTLARGFYMVKATCGTETANQKVIKD